MVLEQGKGSLGQAPTSTSTRAGCGYSPSTGRGGVPACRGHVKDLSPSGSICAGESPEFSLDFRGRSRPQSSFQPLSDRERERRGEAVLLLSSKDAGGERGPLLPGHLWGSREGVGMQEKETQLNKSVSFSTCQQKVMLEGWLSSQEHNVRKEEGAAAAAKGLILLPREGRKGFSLPNSAGEICS